jgi:hypothetical protein
MRSSTLGKQPKPACQYQILIRIRQSVIFVKRLDDIAEKKYSEEYD